VTSCDSGGRMPNREGVSCHNETYRSRNASPSLPLRSPSQGDRRQQYWITECETSEYESWSCSVAIITTQGWILNILEENEPILANVHVVRRARTFVQLKGKRRLGSVSLHVR
jgi:hypothetical protein